MPTKQKESDLEKFAVALAKKNRIYCRKCTGQAAVPDREFLCLGVWVKVEFKRSGEKPTAAQQEEMSEILKHAGFATWVDNKKDVEKLIGHLRHGEVFAIKKFVNAQRFW